MAKTIKSNRRPATAKKSGVSKYLWLMLVTIFGVTGSGIVKVEWSEGKPHISVDQQQAAKISHDLQVLVVSAADKLFGKRAADTQAYPSDVNVAQQPGGVAYTPTNVYLPPLAPRGPESIKIASFNIQVFGTSKLANPKAMQVLTNIIRQFDIVAIQEVRSTDDSVVPTFVNMINAGVGQYSYVIGPRLGRTNSKEQYAIIFDSSRIELGMNSVYTTPDPQDLLHREPLAARFRVRGVPPERAFTFTLVDIHTDPDETKTELNALAHTFVGVQQNGSGEDDVILLGDLNVDEYHLGNLGQLPNIAHAITQVTTNTRRNKMYDNIVFNQMATSEYYGRFGVVDLMNSFGLSEAEALEVSDHCPVWAEFSAYESGNGMAIATRPENPR